MWLMEIAEDLYAVYVRNDEGMVEFITIVTTSNYTLDQIIGRTNERPR